MVLGSWIRSDEITGWNARYLYLLALVDQLLYIVEDRMGFVVCALD